LLQRIRSVHGTELPILNVRSSVANGGKWITCLDHPMALGFP
jgi:hypothetical protein